jgi:hypothetical protein
VRDTSLISLENDTNGGKFLRLMAFLKLSLYLGKMIIGQAHGWVDPSYLLSIPEAESASKPFPALLDSVGCYLQLQHLFEDTLGMTKHHLNLSEHFQVRPEKPVKELHAKLPVSKTITDSELERPVHLSNGWKLPPRVHSQFQTVRQATCQRLESNSECSRGDSGRSDLARSNSWRSTQLIRKIRVGDGFNY